MRKNISKWEEKERERDLFGFVRDLIKEIPQVQFRDNVELQQATKWLHENGKTISPHI